MGCYIVPLIGAICADSIFGRYRTILYFSLIYLLGNILMCLGAIPVLELSAVTFAMLGLFLISVGTGGIKPCVAAFGGDQFHLPAQHKMLQQFFTIFYFTINLGGFVGTIITPILRKWVTCFGDDTCYALGFGFPAALMLLALVLFITGRNWYKMKTPKENVIVQFAECTTYAILHRSKVRNRRHWLDPAKGKYRDKLINDMKTVCAVLFLYLPLPIFWSLFDQQGSRWTFQASHMNGNVLGLQIVPDQVQVVNPAMVLILVPFFEKTLERFTVLRNSLYQMSIGGMFAAMSFFAAGILELILETTYPKLPSRKHATVNFINTLTCDIKIFNPLIGYEAIRAGNLYRIENLPCDNSTKFNFLLEALGNCPQIHANGKRLNLNAELVELQTETVIIGIDYDNKVKTFVTDPVDYQKALSGKPRIRVVYVKSSLSLHNVTVSLKSVTGLEDRYYVHNSQTSFLSDSAYMELSEGVYDCIINSYEKPHLHEESFNLAQGGVYSLVICERNSEIQFFKLYTLSEPNSINILWLLPQYFLMSIAEILFGIAGLEFSFTQAPKSMKTITIAGWYLSVAVGNFLVILITQANFFESQALEFFLFATVMVGDMMLFTEMASKYKFVQLEADSSASFLLEERTPLIQDSYIIATG